MGAQQGASALIGRKLLTLAAAATGGYVAFALAIPLPWVLGSMMGVALLMLLGAGARQPIQGRRAAQITIGAALGLTFTQEIIRQVASLGHWMLLGSVFSIGLTMLFSRAIQRMAKLDGPTAIYSVAVGASAEMALQAQKAGADGAQVASAHAIRIILVVSLASVVAYFSGERAGAYISAATPAISWELALLFVFIAPLCGWLADRLRMPNAWLLGPVLMAGAFAASGTTARMFPAALVLAQILIGWSLGQHMTRQFFLKSPRMLVSATAVTLSMLALCVLLAWIPLPGDMTCPTLQLKTARPPADEAVWERWSKKRTFVRALEGTYGELVHELFNQPRVYRSKDWKWKGGPQNFGNGRVPRRLRQVRIWSLPPAGCTIKPGACLQCRPVRTS